MFKQLKDVRRRVVETVMENVGKSERTVDEDFDMYCTKYQAMMMDMNECGAGLHSILTQQKQFFHDSCEIANSLARVHEVNDNAEYWPGSNNLLESTPAAAQLKQSADYIHNVVRSSCALIMVENAVEPLKETIATVTPDIDTAVKDRNAQVIDYDSYRRRVKGLREKKESLEQSGKTGTAAYTENAAEIAKFEAKETTGKALYEEKNSNTKEKILNAKEQHDHLMNDILVHTAVAQLELFTRAAKELENVIALLPPEKVKEVRSKISSTIQQGGVQTEQKEKSSAQKGLAILTGKNVPSDFKKKDGANPPPPPTATAVPISSASPAGKSGSSNPFGSPEPASSNPFGDDSPPPPSSTSTFGAKAKAVGGGIPPPPPAGAVPPPPGPPGAPKSGPPPPPSAPAGKAPYIVVALFDIEAEADDELTFKAGDKIEVLETSDDGWWKGKINGKVGLFPVNYVQP